MSQFLVAMIKSSKRITGASICLSLLLLSPIVASQKDVIEGQQIFIQNCSPCHQSEGQGKIGLAPSIRNRDFLAIASDEFIEEVITKGRAGTSMPPRPDLAGPKVKQIIAYLRSLKVANPIQVSVDNNKKFHGDAKEGAEKFKLYCASCHGPKGEGYTFGVPGPGIGLPGFLSQASDDYIFQTLKLGRLGTAMKSFLGAKGLANLSESDAHDIIAHLRTLDPTKETAKAVAASHTVSKGDALRGEETFKMNCAPCHQQDGTGHVGLAPSIRNRDFLAIASDEMIVATVTQGRPGTSMIARPDLKGESLNNIIAYLRALEVKNKVSIKVDTSWVAKGDSLSGKKIFSANCAPCHGFKGEGYAYGGSGPAIGLSGFLNTVSDDYIYQTIVQGRVGTPMRSFLGAKGLSNLNKQEIENIIVFLRTLQK